MAGIEREPHPAEIAAHRGLVAVERLTVENLLMFVHHVQKGATLRRRTAADPAPSQDSAYRELRTLIAEESEGAWAGERIHLRFRQMRPFTDGNGRCGRALWLRQAVRDRHDPAMIPLPSAEVRPPMLM